MRKFMKLKVKHVSMAFDQGEILKDISLELNQGELVCLLGASGSGKTTLFNIISGLLEPQQGEIWLNDENITGKPGHVSYMLQKDLLLPYKTVLDNVALPLMIRKKSGEKHAWLTHKKKAEARKKAASFFETFGIQGYEKKYPHQMSGGMRQRAALLRTYLFSQDIALLDEPFSALDTITKSQMHDWYLHVMEKIQLSTLFITHDIDEAILLSDRIYILSGKPGTIMDEIIIQGKKPRTQEFCLTEEFLDYKKKIIQELK
jgi:ABC-type nitrate/sulfonate/bicarbonate transport system ATPase subunit